MSEILIHNVHECASTTTGATSVDTYDHISTGCVPVHPPYRPIVENLLRTGTAVLEHHNRMTLGGIKPGSTEDIAVECHAITLHREEFTSGNVGISCLEGGVVLKHLYLFVRRCCVEGIDRRGCGVGVTYGIESLVGAECRGSGAFRGGELCHFPFAVNTANHAVDGTCGCRLVIVHVAFRVISVVSSDVEVA